MTNSQVAALLNFTKVVHNDTYPTVDPLNLDLHGKHIFLSGASKGIGRAIALSFARAGIGAIALAARSDLADLESEIISVANAEGKKPPIIRLIRLDISSRESIDQVTAELKTFGGIDILINNAGYMEDTSKRAIDSDPDDWWSTWEINVRGTYLLTRALLPIMLERGGDRQIIMLTSIGAFVPIPGVSAYQISKLAILRYTEYLALEYSGHTRASTFGDANRQNELRSPENDDGDEDDGGIVAFAVHPGAIPTELGERLPAEFHAYLTDKPALSADTIVYLASRRRQWLRGRYLSCCWDMDEIMSRKEEIVNEDKLKVKLAL